MFKAKVFKLVLVSGVWEFLRGNESWTFLWHKTSSRAVEQVSQPEAKGSGVETVQEWGLSSYSQDLIKDACLEYVSSWGEKERNQPRSAKTKLQLDLGHMQPLGRWYPFFSSWGSHWILSKLVHIFITYSVLLLMWEKWNQAFGGNTQGYFVHLKFTF